MLSCKTADMRLRHHHRAAISHQSMKPMINTACLKVMARLCLYCLFTVTSLASITVQSQGSEKLQLSATVIYPHNRVAIINNQSYQLGDTVKDSTIIAINPYNIRLQHGHDTQTLYLDTPLRNSHKMRISAGQETAEKPDIPLIPSSEIATTADPRSPKPHSYGPVETGQNLSTIANKLKPDGISRTQMMIALFKTNPQAFSGNINLLHSGAVLTIPDKNLLQQLERNDAAHALATQHRLWHRITSPALDSIATHQYGPIQYGETLSAIARQLTPAGLDRQQWMEWILQNNDQAFNGNIHALKAGSVLTIPSSQQQAYYSLSLLNTTSAYIQLKLMRTDPLISPRLQNPNIATSHASDTATAEKHQYYSRHFTLSSQRYDINATQKSLHFQPRRLYLQWKNTFRKQQEDSETFLSSWLTIAVAATRSCREA